MTVLLTRKAVLQAAIETTYNTPQSVGVNDGFLVSNPMFTIKPNVLERNFVRQDLSNLPFIIGRKLATMEFETELRGNGAENAGTTGAEPLIARLFNACGYGLTPNAASAVKGPYDVGQPVNEVAWTSGGTLSNTDVISYTVTVDIPGVSGTAHVTITSDTSGEGSSSAAITTATPITVGTKGMTLTPVFTGSLLTGQSWQVWLMPPGVSADPVSASFASVTLVLHKDVVKHVMPGSYGTFEITAQAGNFATVKWTFTGQYVAPTDDANPTPVFERALPAQVQVSRLAIGGFVATVEKFTFNQMNDIQVRPDVNAIDGYNGTRIVSRKPEGGIDPEADNIANNDFWGQMSSAKSMQFQMRVGGTVGNTVWVLCPNTQYSGLTYADRNGILVYDAGLRFARTYGNDECCFYFC